MKNRKAVGYMRRISTICMVPTLLTAGAIASFAEEPPVIFPKEVLPVDSSRHECHWTSDLTDYKPKPALMARKSCGGKRPYWTGWVECGDRNAGGQKFSRPAACFAKRPEIPDATECAASSSAGGEIKITPTEQDSRIASPGWITQKALGRLSFTPYKIEFVGSSGDACFRPLCFAQIEVGFYEENGRLKWSGEHVFSVCNPDLDNEFGFRCRSAAGCAQDAGVGEKFAGHN